MSKEIDDKIKSILSKVAKLGWVRKMDDNFFIQLEDVEKIIYGLLDENYGYQIDEWIKGMDVPKELPALEPRDYKWLKNSVKKQGEIIGGIIKGEKCVFKEGGCPFQKKDQPISCQGMTPLGGIEK